MKTRFRRLCRNDAGSEWAVSIAVDERAFHGVNSKTAKGVVGFQYGRRRYTKDTRGL